MEALKTKLLAQLRRIEGVEDRPSPVAGGCALFYGGKEFAHFHDDYEIDVRLTKKLIQELGLKHPAGSVHHPDRSQNSAWIELRFADAADIDKVAALVKLAVTKL